MAKGKSVDLGFFVVAVGKEGNDIFGQWVCHLGEFHFGVV